MPVANIYRKLAGVTLSTIHEPTCLVVTKENITYLNVTKERSMRH